MCLESVAQIFRLFPVPAVGHNGIRAFSVSLGNPAIMDLTAGTLRRGKNKQVCWQRSETRQLLLPRCPTPAGEVANLLFHLWFRHQTWVVLI